MAIKNIATTEPILCALKPPAYPASFHADEAGRPRSDEFEELGAGNAGPNQRGLACRIYAMHGKGVLGEIDSNGDNGSHGLPLPSELMRLCTSHRGTELLGAATARLARDEEVPFIR